MQAESPGIRGFSARNIWNMRNFYSIYQNNPKLQMMSAEISWSKHIAIMGKCKDFSEKEFYIMMAKKQGWTYQVLVENIKLNCYEKYLSSQTNFDKALPKGSQEESKLAVKDEYSFGFLDLDKEHTEKQLENELMKNIRKFLMEMGGDYSFIANQFKVELEDEEYFIDLLLYHRQLRCLVAIELKQGKFKPEHLGKMNFYLSILNDKVRYPEENPTVGIVICQSKNRTVVEYALKDMAKPMGVAQYQITETLPEKLKKYLSSPEKLEASLAN